MKSKYLVLLATAFFFVNRTNAQFGALDTSFNGTGKTTTNFNGTDGGTGVTIQADGKIIVSGYTPVGNSYGYALSRYNTNGTLDASFGTGGKIITDFATGYDFASCVLVQPDGKIVAAGTKASGTHQDNSLVRYQSNGWPDSTFGTNGKVENSIGVADGGINSIKLQADGKIVAAGICTNATFGHDFGITRYNTNGTLDNTFGNNGIVLFDLNGNADFPFALDIQSDGKIVVGGATGPDPVFDFGMIRLDTLGNIDPSFGTNGIVTTDFGVNDEWCYGLVIQPDGKILQCGMSGSPYKIALARYLDNGTLDTTFNSTGKVLTAITTHDEGNALALQADGKIVVAGESWNGSNHDFCVLRYETNGSADTTFGTNGHVTTDFGSNTEQARGVAIQADGKIVVAGSSGAPVNDFAVARYLITLSTGLVDFSSMNNSVFIYPNPVSEQTTLSYSLTKPEFISIQLIDINGKLVKTLVENQYRDASEHYESISLPAGTTSGNYFLVLTNGTEKISIRIVKN